MSSAHMPLDASILTTICGMFFDLSLQQVFLMTLQYYPVTNTIGQENCKIHGHGGTSILTE